MVGFVCGCEDYENAGLWIFVNILDFYFWEVVSCFDRVFDAMFYKYFPDINASFTENLATILDQIHITFGPMMLSEIRNGLNL